MNWLQAVAPVTVERIVNALPEGILIAVFAWILLRILRRQNSGTRFAVWFLALLTVAGLPVLSVFGEGRLLGVTRIPVGSVRSAITLPDHWALTALLAWAFGASVSIMRLALSLWHLRQLHRSCTPLVVAELDPAVRKTLETICSTQSRASKAIAVATSDCVRVPAAIGFWKRTIVLPAWTLRELPANDLNSILLHEFAHLRRADNWTNLIQKIVRALFFFNPAVWWIEQQLSVEREMACDDAVLAETANPRGYATCLISLLEKSLGHRGWSMAQAAVHRASEASLRLRQILDSDRPGATRIWKPAVGMIAGLALACLMALPVAPQFVAFDRGMGSDFMHPAASGRASLQSSLRGPAVIPAALRTSDPSEAAPQIKIVHARVPATQKPAASQADDSRLNGHLEQLVEARASVDPTTQPRYRTLVFVEATQYGSPDAVVWSVQVWRVTLVSAVREPITRIPVANSI